MGWAALVFVTLSLLLHMVTVFHNKSRQRLGQAPGRGRPALPLLTHCPAVTEVTIGRSREVAHHAQPRASWLTEGTDSHPRPGVQAAHQTGQRACTGSARGDPGGTPEGGLTRTKDGPRELPAQILGDVGQKLREAGATEDPPTPAPVQSSTEGLRRAGAGLWGEERGAPPGERCRAPTPRGQAVRNVQNCLILGKQQKLPEDPGS